MSFVGDVFDGLFGGADAAEDAAKVQASASGEGIEEQRRQFDFIQNMLAPQVEAGDLARQQQMAMLGLLGPEAQQAAMQQMQESPGQQFIRERQQRALLRNSGAIGGLGGGNIRTALQEQAAGFAQQDLNNQFNRLGTLSGGGQAATSNLGQFGQASTGNITNLLNQQGQATASGILGAQQANAGMVNNLVQLGSTAATMFSDERLKSNIEQVGFIGPFKIFSWIWNGDKSKDIGFIAQQVEDVRPEFVSEDPSGFLKVDYNGILEGLTWA